MNIKAVPQNPYTIDFYSKDGEGLESYHSQLGLREADIDNSIVFDSLSGFLQYLNQSSKKYESFTIVFEDSGDSYDSRKIFAVYRDPENFYAHKKELIELSEKIAKAANITLHNSPIPALYSMNLS